MRQQNVNIGKKKKLSLLLGILGMESEKKNFPKENDSIKKLDYLYRFSALLNM